MDKLEVLQTLQISQVFFNNSVACFTEDDAGFAPDGGAVPPGGRFTVSQHIAHVGQAVDWFVAPLKTGETFALDFERISQEIRQVNTIADARKIVADAYASAIAFSEEKDQAFLDGALPEGPIMGGAPRHSIFAAIADHTAHHRGVLAVYARLLGKEPAMPYGDL